MVDCNLLGLEEPTWSEQLCVRGEADKAENDSLCRWQAGEGRGQRDRNAGSQLGCNGNSAGKEPGKYELRAPPWKSTGEVKDSMAAGQQRGKNLGRFQTSD